MRVFNDIDRSDALAGLRAVTDWLRENPGGTARVPAGVYRVTSALARETQAAVMRGEYGENPENAMFAREFPYETGLSFDGQRDTALLATGVTMLIDGFMEPIALRACEGVRIEGLTIDYARRPFSRGTVEEVEFEGGPKAEGHITVRFAGEYPVDERTPMPRFCLWDPALGRFDLSVRARDRRYLGGNRVRFACLNMREGLLGCEFYAWHCFHYRPAIRIEEARAVVLSDVTIHSHCGMGVVGHRSENIRMSGLRVVPAPGEHMSTNTDATHFTSCKGVIRFEGCEFEGHGDDATNVHTFYHEYEQTAPDRARAWVKVRTHSATPDYFDVGDEVQAVSARTLRPERTLRVLSAKPRPEANCAEYAFDGPLPENARDWLLINRTRSPRLEFLGCAVRNHWARAVLVKTREARIERCAFETSALWAIHVAAEAWWYEGGPCEDVRVIDCTFKNCGHATREPRRVGGVNVEMDVREHDGRQHGRVEIRGCEFDMPDMDHAVRVADAREVIVSGNVYRVKAEPEVYENCGPAGEEG